VLQIGQETTARTMQMTKHPIKLVLRIGQETTARTTQMTKHLI
jgi:folate-binding Fe-S cluster repair protein YgfZ